MSNIEMNVEEYETVVLELDDGTDAEFAILESFVMGDKKYVLLSEVKGEEISEDVDDMLFMRDDTDSNCSEDEIILSVIESDEEYERVVDFYTEEDE